MKTNLKEKKNPHELIRTKGVVIAGPCSAETEEQLIRTAIELMRSGKTDILRAGIWKPRTNPGGFEGAGTKALSWLLKAKQITGIPIAVEVATPKHAEDALSFETDVLWIGARTTVNPFSVQAIADALRGTSQTVLIKNPVNPDIKLWIGAIERLQKSGIENIGLIHRGFTSYGSTEFRNVPMWQIPIEMKRLFPDLPMICDPSHICGNRAGLLSVAQKSADLDYNGWMIESHCTPENALTDKDQQLTPKELEVLLNSISRKKSSSGESVFVNQLERLREQINYLDEELITLISNRMNIAKEIGTIKKKSEITILQTGRYNEILEKSFRKAAQVGLSEEFIKTYIEALHIESIRIQNTIS
jgi:chorismate mutase